MYSLDFRNAVRSVYEYTQSMRRVGLILKVSSSTVHRWLQTADAPRHWPRRGSKFTDAMVALMQLQLQASPTTTAAQLKALICTKLGVDVSRQLVSLVLKNRLNMSWKRTRKRGCASAKHDRKEQVRHFCKEFITAFTEGTLVACDESGFDQRARPVYGYAPRSKPAILVIPSSKAKHVHHSLVLAAHMLGLTYSSLHVGSVNGPCFATFLNDLPFPRGSVIVLDNASIHKCAPVRQIAVKRGYKLLFTPPYTPEFNPIEMMFGIIKNKFYKDRYSMSFSSQNMSDCIRACVNHGSHPSCVSACFRHVVEGLKAHDIGESTNYVGNLS